MNAESAFTSSDSRLDAGSRHRVLVVDDNRDFANSLRDLLDEAAWRVDVVYDADDALESLDRFAPDIALIDLSLGKSSGIELVGRMKQTRPSLVCILITGYADIKAAVDALRSGCDDFFSKPIKPDELFAALERGVAKLAVIRQKEAAEAALQASEIRYRQLVEMAPDAIFIQSGGKLVFANPAGAGLLGVAPQEALRGRRVFDFVHPDDMDLFLDAYHGFESAGKPVRFPDFRILQATGGVRHVESYVSPIDYEGAAGYLIIAHDVTDRLQAEEHLRESQKLEVVSHLTTGIAHDFNNLLAIVMGNLQLLQRIVDGRFLAGNEAAAEIVAAAIDASRQGAKLVKNLLAFARKQPLLPVFTDINHLIDESLDMILQSLGDRWELRLALRARPARVMVDQTQLLNAVLNLIVNARLALPDGGVIEIATANVWIGKDDRFDDLAAGAYVMLSVRDEGAGMAPDVVERAFDPFFTTRKAGEGSGLGLSMVHGFAKQSNGSAKIESRPGKGTTVSIFLPQIDEIPASAGHGREKSRNAEIGPDRR